MIKLTDEQVLRLLNETRGYMSITRCHLTYGIGFDVWFSEELSKQERRLIEEILGVELKPDASDGFITFRAGGVVLNKAVVCKQVGMKKVKRTRSIVTRPADYAEVTEEVEVPVYECPDGKRF